MITTTISENPKRMDEEYWTKKKELQFGTRVLIAHNLEGNMDEPFIGMEGNIIRIKSKDWYQVILEKETIYGKKFNFHIDELEIVKP